MSQLRDTRVAIVGGGLGGVTAAILLQDLGCSVRVYEQAPEFARVGAGIQLSPNVMRIMRHIGLDAKMFEVGLQPREKLSRDWRTGEITYAVPLQDMMRLYGAHYLIMHRGDMHAIMVDALRPGVLQLSKQLIDLDETAGAVRMSFADGTSAEADIVIGADGVDSRIREIMLSPEPPTYTGFIGYRSVFPKTLIGDLQIPDSSKWWADDRHLVIYHLTNRRDEVYFVTGVPDPDWRPEDFSPMPIDPAEVRAAFAHFHSEVRAVLAACPYATKAPLLERKPFPFWSRGRVVLLGDACHPMPPHMGQGAGMAIEDAVMLTRCLEATSEYQAAVQLYARMRIERTARVQKESHDNEWIRYSMDHEWLFGHDVLTVPLIDVAPNLREPRDMLPA
jgi:6-hydroxynicotinate 3-monooxygenase